MNHAALKEMHYLRAAYRLWKAYKNECQMNPFLFLRQAIRFLKERSQFEKAGENEKFNHHLKFLYPCLTDSIRFTPMDPIYFYQGVWGARKVFELKPEQHYDIGSSAIFVGILSQFCPVTMIDIRPLPLKLQNLNFQEGSVLALPFADDAIQSISSLCVIEHIGLGRYGDPIDPFGSEKAFAEIKRVLAPGGRFIFSLPVDTENRIYFNAHRAFTRDYVMELFQDFELLEEAYIYADSLCEAYDPQKGFGTGMWYMRKPMKQQVKP